MGTLSARVEVDPRTFAKVIVFSQPVTAAQASTYLYGSPARANLLSSVGPGGTLPATRLLLNTSNVEAVMALRPDIRDAIVQGSVLRSNAPPTPLAAWIPVDVRNAITSGRQANGVARYKGTSPWGDIVVWKNSSTVEAYQEFPSAIDFYVGIAHGDKDTGRLLHYAYTQYNKDMKYFVEERGKSPESARAEIRRINDEVFKLVIEAAAGIVTAGAGITAVGNAMRASAKPLADAVRRSEGSFSSVTRVKPVNGKVNVGGGFETPNMTNLNPCKPGSGGPTSGIPNHLAGGMEQMDQLLEPNSVEYLMSSKLRFVDVNWSAAAQAAAKSMRSGGKVEMNIWCTGNEIQTVVRAFQNAGFRDVKAIGDGVGTMLTAVR